MHRPPSPRPAFVALALAGFAPPGGEPPPALLPHPSAYRMAGLARAVVEGTIADDGAVLVTKRWYETAGSPVAPRIRVPALAQMPMVPGLGLADAPAIEPDRVLLFLADNPRDDEWVPMHLVGAAARGVLWFQDSEVYGYAQEMNPGPYCLSRWLDYVGDRPVHPDPDAVRRVVEAGVAARARWQASLAIEDRAARAAALARWFAPATSPDGERWRERLYPDLIDAATALGSAIVPELARLVAEEPSVEDAGAAAEALSALGTAARPAVPAVLARLRAADDALAERLVRVLRANPDPVAIGPLRELLGREAPWLVAAAAHALAAAGDPDVATLLAALLPAAIDGPAQRDRTAILLEALHDLDAARAERIVRERFLDDAALLQQRAWLRRLAR